MTTTVSNPQRLNPVGDRRTVVAFCRSPSWRSQIRHTIGALESEEPYDIVWALDHEEIEQRLDMRSRAVVLWQVPAQSSEQISLLSARRIARRRRGSHLLIALDDGLAATERHALAVAGFAAVLDAWTFNRRLPPILCRHFQFHPPQRSSIEHRAWQNLPWPSARSDR